ncbi:MAG: hypothetical protein K8R59_12095, partial [Thermoanaerobaculales bacterium]|nr:hypothetical protein [Thermoanaerobaculales bacterium]
MYRKVAASVTSPRVLLCLVLLVFGGHSVAALSPPQWVDTADPFAQAAYSFRVFRDSDGLPQNTVHAITRDKRGFLWVGTQDGAAYYDGRNWTVVNMPSRLKSNFVRSILSSSDGSLWFATQAGGIFRLFEDQWTVAEELCRLSKCVRAN